MKMENANENLIVWEKETLNDFTKNDQLANHNLHNHPLFSDEGLIKIIDAHPKDRLEVFTMGYNPIAWGEWYLGRYKDLDGRALMEAVKAGRIWLNLRKCNCEESEVTDLCSQLFNEIKDHTNVATMKHDMGLLISSPNAHVFYHADMPLVMLVQIRGIKKVYLYPPNAPFINDNSLEGIALKEKDEQLQYNQDWDKDAYIHDLKPGEFLTWRQNAPHRIINHDCVNVSFSIEFLTPRAAWRANLLYANGCLRRYFGLKPSIESSLKILEPIKIIYARIVKLLGGYKGKNQLPTPKFTLDNKNLGQLHFDDGIAAPQKN